MGHMRNYARLLTRSADRAEDLLQDTLLRALEKRHLFRPQPEGGGIRAWLGVMMFRLHVTHARASSSRVSLAGTAIAEQQPDPRSSADCRAIVADAAKSLAALPADQQRLLTMVALGWDYGDMAATEGIPTGTVRSRIFRGRQSMLARYNPL